VAKYGLPFSPGMIKQRFGSWRGGLVATARAMNGSGDEFIGPDLPSSKRTALSVRRRFDVLKRDGYKCRICRKAGGELEVDHIVPVSKGGTNDIDNLQTMCRACNRGKGTKLM